MRDQNTTDIKNNGHIEIFESRKISCGKWRNATLENKKKK